MEHSSKNKKISGIASANHGSRRSILGTVEKEKNGSEVSGRGSQGLQKKAKNLENGQKEMGARNADKRFGNIPKSLLCIHSVLFSLCL